MSDDYSSLERFALEHARSTLVMAHGTCLHATLELAVEARRLGLGARASIVRWALRRDPAFTEHWALVLEDGRVLDTTAVQVDGDPRPLRTLDEYPAKFQSPRRYPMETILSTMSHNVLTADDRYPRRLIWRLHWRLFLHDAGNGVRSMAPRELCEALVAILRCGFALAISYLIDCAAARAQTLMRRTISSDCR